MNCSKVMVLGVLCFLSIGGSAWAPASAEDWLPQADGIESRAKIYDGSAITGRVERCGPGLDKLEDPFNEYDQSYGDWNCTGNPRNC